VKPHLEHLDEVLGLESHTRLSASEQFSQDYMKAVKGLPSVPTIRYLPDLDRRR